MDYHDFCGIRQWIIIELDGPEPPKELDPYRKLFMAIFMDAVETLKKGPTSDVPRYVGQRHYKTREARLHPISDALEWLMSDDDCILGFVSICEYLGWEPTAIRKRALEAIKKAKEHPEAPRRNNVATDGKRRRKWA